MKIGNGTSIWSVLGYLTASATAGGETGYVQINTGGSIDGDAQFTYDSSTNTLHVSGAISGSIIKGDTILGSWSGSQIKASYIEDYIASSSVRANFAPSSGIENDGFANIQSGDSIAHGLSSTPMYVNVVPSSNVINFGISCRKDDSNIYVYLTAPKTLDVYWYASL